MSANSNTLFHDPESANREINRLRNELHQALAENSKAREETCRTLHDLAREFRVPLASVLGFTDLLSATYKSNPAELNQIAMAGHQLMELVKRMERTAAAEAPAPDQSGDDVPPRVEPTPPAMRTVLHIEDNETNFHLVERILEDRENIEMLWAPSGEAGLAVACQRTPALILLDLNLPDIHGRDVLARLRNNPLTGCIPVIILSADVSPSEIERMLQAGARNYLTKPFDIKRLLCLVDESLGRAA
jgi:CheY-like chemotaxis protein